MKWLNKFLNLIHIYIYDHFCIKKGEESTYLASLQRHRLLTVNKERQNKDKEDKNNNICVDFVHKRNEVNSWWKKGSVLCFAKNLNKN